VPFVRTGLSLSYRLTMTSSEGDFPPSSWDNFNENYIMRNKYGRHKDKTGRWVPNNPGTSINAQKFGEDRTPYIVESKEKFDINRRPEAGYYLDYLLNEKIVMDGPGKNVIVVKLDFIKKIIFLFEAASERNIYPYCIVVSPTKELAEQLYEDTLVLSADLNCIPVLSFGEICRQDNILRIKDGCDIFICTVGRLCDYLQNEVLKLHHLHFLVFDEADRLLQLDGFHDDLVENLLPKCRPIPNLRKLLFSATDYNDLAELKEEFSMPNATKVVVGVLNSVNPFVEQRVLNVEVHEKREKLLALVQKTYLNNIDKKTPKTIIFVNTKRFATVIACYLSLKGYKAYPIHGLTSVLFFRNLTAKLRREAIEALQSGDCDILVSTDLAARGLDIKGISHVINYEIPKSESFLSYIHRVGRTGRVGNFGRATTFFAPSVDRGMALRLYGWLQMNKQEIPTFLFKEVERQVGIENLQKIVWEEYEQALYMESSDGEMDH
ncbi:unnamed protein product, partial [Acanthocheilonema viteae]